MKDFQSKMPLLEDVGRKPKTQRDIGIIISSGNNADKKYRREVAHERQSYKLFGMFFFGIMFYMVYIMSIFDVYFRTPLVHGMEPVNVGEILREFVYASKNSSNEQTIEDLRPPAKRVVFIVGDGLRVDKLFELDENGRTRAPYFRDIISSRGSWGISHTRVPTESRPGHVALMAGFYEDVSSVTKGWKVNPVVFDSVINQSSFAFLFGSSDIVSIFQNGAKNSEKVQSFVYSSENQDFASKDASLNDVWVFEHVTELFRNAKENEDLNRKLRGEKIFLFLHLLGLDTNGHAHYPNSQEYYDNIRLVDQGIKDIEKLLNGFYGDDGKTAFIFSSDHGMSDRGNHGDGDPHCTRTPIIAWGAGIQLPSSMEYGKGHDEISKDWNLMNYERKDIQQADVAALISSLLGISFPMNSIGVVPISYLNTSDVYKSAILFTNVRAILAQFIRKGKSRKERDYFFVPYSPLSEEILDRSPISEEIGDILIHQNLNSALSRSFHQISLSLEGLSYLQTYDRNLLLTIITCGYVGFFMVGCQFMFGQIHQSSTNQRPQKSGIPNWILKILVFLTTFTFASIYLCLRGSPWSYYVYIAMPIILGTFLLEDLRVFCHIYRIWNERRQSRVLTYAFYHILILELVVLTYFYRFLLSCGLVVLYLWSWSKNPSVSARPSLNIQWKLCLGILSLFPIFRIDNGERLLYTGMGIFLLLGLSVLVVIERIRDSTPQEVISNSSSRRYLATYYTLLYVVYIGATMLTIYDTSRKFHSKSGLPLINQCLSWSLSIASILTMATSGFILRIPSRERLMEIIVALGVPYSLLNASYELIFYVVLGWMLILWIEMEHLWNIPDISQVTISNTTDYPRPFFRLDDLRLASWLLLLSNLSFFGTGNVASVSSFTLSSVYRFVTIFSPFLMGGLLIFKILIPFLIVYSAFGLVTRILSAKIYAIFVLILTVSSLVILQFFYKVKNEGTWLEIGRSISHFFIASSLIVLMLILNGFTEPLIRNVVFNTRPTLSTSLKKSKAL